MPDDAIEWMGGGRAYPLQILVFFIELLRFGAIRKLYTEQS